MQVYCGTDLIRVSRVARAVERLGDRFLKRIYHVDELACCGWPDHLRLNSLAARFAAKEAVAKALGTGVGPMGIRWTDIRIVRQTTGSESPVGLADMTGQPVVVLTDRALDRYHDMSGQSISISMSHDGDLALAFCVICSMAERTEVDCH